MKHFICMLMLLALTKTTIAQNQLNIGDEIPNIVLENLLNAPKEKISLQELKGKVIIIDFWATWCGPCIPAMVNLQKLQAEFPEKLQVIGIAEDKVKRLKHFISKNPSKAWFGLQTEELEALFPFKILSHAIIINPEGKIAAITSTDHITKNHIVDLLKGKTISLPLKKENVSYDYSADPFPTKKEERVLLKGGIKGVSSYSRGYLNDSIYKDRRLTLINQTIPGIYRHLYQTSYLRTVYEVDENLFNYDDPENKYCLDIISKQKGTSMYTKGLEVMDKSFDIKGRMEKRKVTVYVVEVIDESKVAALKSTSDKRSLEFRGGTFNGKKITMKDFADYIENACPVPVVDETNCKTLLDIDFEFDLQQKGSFQKALATLGMKLKKTEREIDMLVIYK